VHGFAQQSGGRIEVASSRGEGATFTLVLPRGNPAETAAATPAASSEAAAQFNGDVLLVEDDEAVADMTGAMLEHLGWRVRRVASAEQALAALRDGAAANLVFSDVMMPGGKNGIELAREVRATYSGLPVILASGYADSVRREAEAQGLTLLAKPFETSTLANAIRRATLL
jgi:CheY-like chemotaxis protein